MNKVIKPNQEKKSLLMPIIYLILGIILALKNNEAVTLIFYIIGILVIIIGINYIITYFKDRDNKVSLTVGGIALLLGILLTVLAKSLEISIRYVLGFFLIFMGVSRLITNPGRLLSIDNLSNIVLIILGIFSVFVSNIILVIIGVILILNALILIWEYFKGN